MSFALKPVLLLTVAAMATPVGAAWASDTHHDGIWTVTTSAEDGACNTNYDFKMRVKNGEVTYAGFWPVKATGGINRAGLIRMNLAHSGQSVKATGLVRGDTASGDWTSPKPACSGSWVAKRA
ncbi:hypothetical protein FHS55_000213 [Angulomicrobium tetraedrale]|uniref:Uncharacterized protein n=1 Tax=Ancylobacter tetraedralis TaxID=217068 RepID=A0A839Z8C1_9HYPH|nr:hypothetical protein [Ancylobacter tetraedralis]MBB3769627.1 hypothetical protein [Ancylobacter tetraedralis]